MYVAIRVVSNNFSCHVIRSHELVRSALLKCVLGLLVVHGYY